jgi:hypothetical protein
MRKDSEMATKLKDAPASRPLMSDYKKTKNWMAKGKLVDKADQRLASLVNAGGDPHHPTPEMAEINALCRLHSDAIDERLNYLIRQFYGHVSNDVIYARGEVWRLIEKHFETQMDARRLQQTLPEEFADLLELELANRQPPIPAMPLGEPFSPLQSRIWKALCGSALKKQPLANIVCGGEASRLYKPNGIKEMQEAGIVRRKDTLGYYRPDAPPTA